MKLHYTFICAALFLISFSLSSCTADDELPSVEIVDYPQEGLLGETILVQLNHVPEGGNLQVFFDAEKAQVMFLSDTEIYVVIPRSIKTAKPILKIINLITNEEILKATFSLKAPVISGYSLKEVSFDQVFSIQGDNFDVIDDDVKVYVNNQLANIIKVGYKEIKISLPYAISNSNLQIKVEAQRQEINSTIGLQLSNPIITGVSTPTAWIRGELVVDGSGFNPNDQFGQVFINGIKCYYTAQNTQLKISTPPGPFNDFKVNSISYTTAGLTTIFDANIPIGNDAIMVDYQSDINNINEVFVHKDKAYNLTSFGDNFFNEKQDYVLYEFTASDEKWKQINSFHYTGAIVDAVYDGNENLYLYKYISSSGTYVLTKLNMNSFVETTLSLPYNKISSPILFAYQSNLYLLSGVNNINGDISIRTEKYKYSETSESWSTLSPNSFSELPLSTLGGGKCKYLHFNNNIYLNYGSSFKTYKITPNLSVSDYGYIVSFGYKDAVIGRYGNSNSEILYNIATNAQVIVQNDLIQFNNNYFVLNDQIYFFKNSWTEYFQNTTYTQKLRPSILNGIL